MSGNGRDETLVTLTAEIVSAHLSNNPLAVSDVAPLIGIVHGALAGLGPSTVPTEAKPEPAVTIRASVRPDYLVCLEDGKTMKVLKRHLMASHQMTPDAYRARWDLPEDYPMAAPNYSERRRAIAKNVDLGAKGRRRSRKAASKK